MSKFIRDTNFEQLVRLMTQNRVPQHPEEQQGFQLPDSYTKSLEAAELRSKNGSLPASSQDLEKNGAHSDPALPGEENSTKSNEKPQQDDPFAPKILDNGTMIITWYGSNDPANPQNWTASQKLLSAAILITYTFSVYLGSSIFVGSYGGVISQVGVSEQVVSLCLSMYVLAYGLGTLLWSPLSEIPSLGRGPLYMITYTIFVVLLVPTALVDNLPGLVVPRFLLGFFGSPCLATGPASLGDMFSLARLPSALATWAFVATCDPFFGPMLSGYSVPPPTGAGLSGSY